MAFLSFHGILYDTPKKSRGKKLDHSTTLFGHINIECHQYITKCVSLARTHLLVNLIFKKRWRSNFLSINWKISTIWLAKSSDISVSVWNTNRRIFEVFQKERWFLSYIGPCACTGPCVICALREHICVSLEPGIWGTTTHAVLPKGNFLVFCFCPITTVMPHSRFRT